MPRPGPRQPVDTRLKTARKGLAARRPLGKVNTCRPRTPNAPPSSRRTRTGGSRFPSTRARERLPGSFPHAGAPGGHVLPTGQPPTPAPTPGGRIPEESARTATAPTVPRPGAPPRQPILRPAPVPPALLQPFAHPPLFVRHGEPEGQIPLAFASRAARAVPALPLASRPGTVRTRTRPAHPAHGGRTRPKNAAGPPRGPRCRTRHRGMRAPARAAVPVQRAGEWACAGQPRSNSRSVRPSTIESAISPLRTAMFDSSADDRP